MGFKNFLLLSCYFAFCILTFALAFSPVFAQTTLDPKVVYDDCVNNSAGQGGFAPNYCSVNFPNEEQYSKCVDSANNSGHPELIPRCQSEYVDAVTTDALKNCITGSPTDPEVCRNYYSPGGNYALCIKSYGNPKGCETKWGMSQTMPTTPPGAAIAPGAPAIAPFPSPKCDTTTGFCPAAGITQLQQLLTRIINISVTIAFMALTVWLIWGALKFFIISGGDPKALAHAWSSVTWAFMGIFFLVLAWLILKLIFVVTGAPVTSYCLGFPPYCI